MKKLALAIFCSVLSGVVLAQDATSTASGTVAITPKIVTAGDACEGVGMAATDADGYVLSCQENKWQRQFTVKEELLSIVGCYEPSDFCANLNGSPAGTEYNYDPIHTAHTWRAKVGPRTFCSIGFFAYGNNTAVTGGAGNFCRVVPGDVDVASGKTNWYIKIGSSNKSYVGCHALCVL